MDLPSVGLEHLVPNAQCHDVPVGPEGIGPDGNPVKNGPGKVWGWTQVGTSFYAEKADWIPAFASLAEDGRDLPAGRYWIGIHKELPPTPEELQKIPHPKYSRPVTDLQGRTWLIPVARRFPMILGRGSDGSIGFCRTPEQFREYFDRMEPFFQAGMEGKLREITPQAWWLFGNYVLTQNYRMTMEVADRLDVLDGETIFEVMEAALGIKDVEDQEKELQEGAQKN